MAPDKYSCYADLEADEKNGIDYRICLALQDSRFLIAAVHGGKIEPGTSQIAHGAAGNDHSLYQFEGLKDHCYSDLHITSARFDEPLLMRAIADGAGQLVVLAIHGACDSACKNNKALVGGKNTRLKGLVIQELKAAGIQAGDAANNPKLAGREPLNICNRGNPDGGVQIEFSRAYRDSLFEEGEAKGEGGTPNDRFSALCAALRQALQNY